MNANKQNKFWNSFAGKYDGFIERYSKNTYERSLKLMKNELQSSNTVLEIGTGTGIIAFAIANHTKEIIAIDYAEEMIQMAQKKQSRLGYNNITFILNQANNINYPDQSFDIVIASNLFHLLPDARETLKEIYRVLRDDGKAILPTYCHGQNIKSRVISAIMGLSGFRAVNRWSTKAFRAFVTDQYFQVIKEEVIQDKIPLSFLVVTKQK